MRLRSLALPFLASMVVLGPNLRRATAQIVPPFPTGSFPPVSWPTIPPVATTAPTPTTVTSAKTGPYVRGADYALTAKTTAPKTSLLAAATPFPRFAPDGKALLLAGATTRLGSLTAPLGVVLKGTRGYRSAWSPDSKNVVTSDEDGQLVVWAVPTGKEVRRIDDAFKQMGSVGSGKYWAAEVGFPDAKTVLFHSGCRLKKLDLSTTGAAPVALGLADKCGRPQVSQDGKRWVLLEQGAKQNYGIGLWYSRAYSIDTTTGAHTSFLDESKVGAFTDVQLSPTGDRLCFVHTTRKVSCVTVADGKVDDVSEGPADRWLGFDNAGMHLLYADDNAKDKSLHHVDFAARTVRRVAKVSVGVTDWKAFAGDRRLIAYGHDGGTIYDLDKLWSQPVFPKVEVEGFAPVPGDPSRAILGKASGPSRDLYWLTVSD